MKPLLPKKNNSLLAKRPKLVLTCLDYFSVGFFVLSVIFFAATAVNLFLPIRTTIDENGRIVTSNLVSTESYLQNEYFKGKLGELDNAQFPSCPKILYTVAVLPLIFSALLACYALLYILREIICDHFNFLEREKACKFYKEGKINTNFNPSGLPSIIITTLLFCAAAIFFTSPLIDLLFRAQKYYLTDSMRSSLLYFKNFSTSKDIEDILYYVKTSVIVGQIFGALGFVLRTIYNALVYTELSDDF